MTMNLPAARRRSPARSRSRFMKLEQRVLFDGAGMVDALAAMAATDAPAPTPEAAPSAPGQIAFVDATLPDAGAIAAGFGPDTQVVMLEAGSDPWQQITATLSSHQAVSAIHLVSHGDEQTLIIGGQSYGAAQMEARTALLQSWRERLTADADLLLYGCKVGAGETASSLLTVLADATGADVAASADATAPTALGGNTVLEVTTGAIEATTASLTGLEHALAAPTVTAPTATYFAIEPSALNAANADRVTLSGWTLGDDGVNSPTVTVNVTVGDTSKGTINNPGGDMSGTVTTITGGLRYVGTVANAQIWLNQLQFVAADVELGVTAASTTITVQIVDGETTPLSASATATVTVTPSNDPVLVPDGLIAIPEATTGTVITIATLAAADPEVTAGTQNASQIVYRLTATHEPQFGYLTLDGARISTGSLFTQADVVANKLRYVHTATGAQQNSADRFSVSINDGATPQANSDTAVIDITITPSNQAPSISNSSGVIYEGQPQNATSGGTPQSIVGNFIVADGGGDPGDSMLTIRITSLPDNSRGTLYFNGTATIDGVATAINRAIDAGDLAGLGFVIAYADRDKLTYSDDGTDPVANVNIGFSITDGGGGLGIGSALTTNGTLTIQTRPVNDDPVFDTGSTLSATVTANGPNGVDNSGGDDYSVVLTPAVLEATDVDSPDSSISFAVTVLPTRGELRLNNRTLQLGATFTMADIAAGNVTYVQTAANPGGTLTDTFDFVIRDNTLSLRWDPAGEDFERTGGDYVDATAGSALLSRQFTITLATTAAPVVGAAGGTQAPTPAPTPETDAGANQSLYAGDNPAGDAISTLDEGGSVTLLGADGNALTPVMLNYSAAGVPATQIVYTVKSFASWSGELRKSGTALNAYDTFTQDDVNNGRITFLHDGGETFESSVTLQVSAGGVSGGTALIADDVVFRFFISPVNDAPGATGSSDIVIAEGATRVLTTGNLSFSDPDDATSAAYLENTTTGAGDNIGDNFAINNTAVTAVPGGPLQFKFTGLPTHGTLQYDTTGTGNWVAVTATDVTNGTLYDSTHLTASTVTSRFRYVHDGLEDRTDQFKAKAVDRRGAEGGEATVAITITNVNDGPEIAQTPDVADPVVTAPNAIGGAPVNEPLDVVQEGGFTQITAAMLQAYDPDSTNVQVQYRITTAPTHGRIAYSTNGTTFTTIGVGSSFSQSQVAAGYIYYVHNGDDPVSTGYPTTPDDKFLFTLADGDKEQTAREFGIYVKPTNDAPTVTAPSGPINLDSLDAQYNRTTLFQVSDPDLVALNSQEQNFLQVTVRLLQNDGTPFLAADYNPTGGTDVTISYKTGSGASVVGGKSGVDDYLTLQGTAAQINDALTELAVTFTSDRDTLYRIEVLVDDRYRNGSGALIDNPLTAATPAAEANGGPLNTNPTPTVAQQTLDIPNTEPDYYSVTNFAAWSGNIAKAYVQVRASNDNDPHTLTVPGAQTPYEDTAFAFSLANGNRIVIADPESTAFGLSVRLTLAVSNGTLAAGASSGVTIDGSVPGSLILTGTVDNIQTLLNTGFTYTGNSNYNVTDTLTVTFDEHNAAVGDDTTGGSVKNANLVQTVALDLIAVNDAPSVSIAPATARAIGTNAAVAITGVSIGDANDAPLTDAGETDFAQVTVRLLNADGSPLADYTGVTLAVAGGATMDATWSGNAKPLVMRGTLAQVNTALTGLNLTMNGDRDTAYKLQVLVDDRLRDGSGVLTAGADGGAKNQQDGLPDVPNTDSFATDPVNTTTAAATATYNIVAQTVDIYASSSNDPPVNVMPAAITVAEDSTNNPVRDGSNNYIQISDSDDFGANFTVVLTAANGLLRLPVDVAGVTGDNVTTAAASITLTGSKTNINTALQSLQFTPTANLHGASGIATIQVQTTDTALAGSGANQTDVDVVHIAITAVNDQPAATLDVTLAAANEDTTPSGVAINTLNFSYTDATDNRTGTTNTVPDPDVAGGNTSGPFSYIAIVGDDGYVATQGSWQVSTTNNPSPSTPADWITIPDSDLSQTAALIFPSDRQIRFVPAGDFHGTPGKLIVRLADNSATPAVSASASDTKNLSSNGGTGTTGAWNAADRSIGISVTNVNDRPTATNATLAPTTEDATDPPGATVASLGFGYADVTDNQTTAQTGIPGGGPTSNATTFGGIAIVGNAANAGTEGVWQYNTSGTWVTIGTPGDTTALILPTTASLRFLPNVANYNGTPGSLTLRVADTVQAFSAASDITGNLTQTSTWSATVTLGTAVTKLNDAPTLTQAATNPTATENGSTGGVTSIDPIALLTSGTVADIDLTTTAGLGATVFGTGTITATLTDGVSGDSLILDAGLPLPSGVTVSGGLAANALVITLDADTTLAEVKSLLEAIQYKHIGDNPTSYGADTTRSYIVVLNDGNNVQAGGNAGGSASDPDLAMNATTINGTITIVATNDPPTATNDAKTVTEDTASTASGNVKTGSDGTLDTDPDNTNPQLSISGIRTGTESGSGTAGTVGTALTGTYGSLTINADGSYTYVLDNTNPTVNALTAASAPLTDSFTYTLSDGSATDTAQLTITINGFTDGGPTITPVDGNGAATGQATVRERGLADADGSQTTTGTLSVTALSGLASVTVGGTAFTVAQLAALSTGSPSAVIDTGEGELRITSITTTSGPSAAPTAASIAYTYTLKARLDHTGGTAIESTDIVALTVTDASSQSNNGTLTLGIIDDTPTARNDTNAITRGNASVSGNAITAGGGIDRQGADTAATATGISHDAAAGVIGVPRAGTYGSLTLAANGSYSYALNNSHPTVASLRFGESLTDTFTYTITDADGDSSTATIRITINGSNDGLPPLPSPPAVPPTAVPPIVSQPIVSPFSVVPRFSRVGFDPSLHVLNAVADSQRQLAEIQAATFGPGGTLDKFDIVSPSIEMAMDPALHVLPTVGGARQDAAELSARIRASVGTDFSSRFGQTGLASEIDEIPGGTPGADAPPPAAEGSGNPPAGTPPAAEPLAADEPAGDDALLLAATQPLHRGFNEQMRLAAQRLGPREQAAKLERALVAQRAAVRARAA